MVAPRRSAGHGATLPTRRTGGRSLRDVSALDVDTPYGPARVHLHPVRDTPAGALVLGHGAGGGVAAPDLVAACEAALEAGWSVALVEQPYRVAGRRSPAPARQLDAAWTAVLAGLRSRPLAGLRLVTGGRSSGARVACRTAAECDVAAVLCLAFPLHPPGKPEKSRLDELEAVDRPVLIVQGESDPFGMPPAAPRREVVAVPGDHSLKRDRVAVAAAVTRWLGEL
jgi:predicted alpha/beta-hydrolase family hydrolase